MIILSFCGIALLVSFVVFVVYLIAHSRGYDRGYLQGRDDVSRERFNREMDSFWQHQDFRREHGYSYMRHDGKMVDADG